VGYRGVWEDFRMILGRDTRASLVYRRSREELENLGSCSGVSKILAPTPLKPTLEPGSGAT